MKILLAAATGQELAPLREWLGRQDAPFRQRIEVLRTGVGLMAATFALTKALAGSRYDLVIGAGIAGAFDRSIALGECVIVQSEALGDLGAEDNDDFLDVFSLGLEHQNEAPFTSGQLVNELNQNHFKTDHLRRVSSLTVNTVSGSAPTIAARSARFGAQIESMEGAALHYVCLQMGVPFLQVRAISNYVTPRNRPAWKIPEAVASLNAQIRQWLQP